ncbi:Trimethyllysine dioxygenase [Lophiostoma macrostomum CBS 122681]|uniref:Trimethyllysine dioxygenase n=1 Tax=Lophiostoma macrostomum CBS 122681 TaxID=1314788 RepID=A0A6A6T1S1_9PLEO|nr:Trimethyllysine dioxygenase [Lophiostoma macrostomum CBS 122681]
MLSLARRSTIRKPSRSLQSSDVDTVITVEDNVVKARGVEFPNIWLRDNCQCSSCVHDATRQRLIDIFEIPQDISIRSSEADAGGINIEWSDGHKSYYKNKFLHNATGTFRERAIVRQGLRSPSLWGSEIKDNPPTVSYEDVIHEDSHGLYTLLSNIRTHGFTFIDSVPHTTSTPTESLLTRISFIRPTHYGAFYDFTADLSSKDMAYTSVSLPAHTDTTYFSDPAGLQAFHLLSHTHGTGGASLLVDGFKAARDLYDEDPDAYRILSTVNVHAHASGNDGISIQPYRGFPVLSHDAATGFRVQVRWNTADRAAIELPVSETGAWYSAARKFDAVLKRQQNEYWEQLTPGRVLLFDNWRVLHGRSAFTGKRRICGAYVNRDDWVSRWKMARWGQEEVLGRLAAG